MTISILEELRSIAEKRVKPLLDRREQLRKELSGIDAEIASVQRAISAIEGKDLTKQEKTPANARKKRERKRPSASPEVVKDAMLSVLKKAGGKLNKDEMKEATKELLREDGYDLTGLKQRFDKQLEVGECFASRGSGVSLRVT